MVHNILLTIALATFILQVQGCSKKSSTGPPQELSSVEIIFPQAGASVFGTVEVRVSVTSEKPIVRVELLIDGKTDSSLIRYSEPYDFTWQVPDGPDSTIHTMQAQAMESDSTDLSSSVIKVAGYRFAPTNLKTDFVSEASIKLEWQNNSKFAKGFLIERSMIDSPFVQIDSIGSAADTITLPGPYATNVNYSFRVRAVSDSNASKYTNTVTVNIPYPAPFNLQVESSNDSTMNLTWQDTSAIKQSFEVDMAADGVNFQIMELMGISGAVGGIYETSITYPYSIGQNYYFRVRSYSKLNKSPYSMVADTSAVFLPPTDLVLADSSSSGIQLKWKNGSRFTNQFRIERETGTQGFSLLATVGSNITTYTDSALDPSQVYQYRVRAENGSYSTDFTQPVGVQFNLSNNYAFVRAMTGHTDWVGHVGFTSNDNVLVSSSSDNTIKFWDVKTGSLLQSLKVQPASLGWPPAMGTSNAYFAFCDSGAYVDVYDANTMQLVKKFAMFAAGISFSPDGQYLAAVGVGNLTMWRVSDWSEVMTAVSYTDRLEYSLSISPDDQYIVAGSGGYNTGAASIVQVSTGTEVTILNSGSWGVMWGVGYGSDGKSVAVTTQLGQVLVFRASDGALLKALSPTNPQAMRCVAYSLSGNVLATGGDNGVIDLWDMTFSHVAALSEGQSDYALGFTHSGLYLASANFDHNVRLYRNKGKWGIAH